MPPAVSSERPATRSPDVRSPDERLHHARRLDWRFLLPTPDLGSVTLGGAPSPDVREAIAVATGTDPVELGDGAVGRFDTVVLGGRLAQSDLVGAVAALAPEGHLVVEVDGPLAGVVGRRRGAPSASATRLARSLVAGGFDVRRWLAWPAIGRIAAFAAVDDRVAVEALVGRRLGVHGNGRAARFIGRLSGTSAIDLLAPGLLLVARRGRGRAGLVERRLASTGLLLLAPRYRASAHVVGLGLGPNGTVERVAKVARLRDDQSLVHEAEVLSALGHARATASGPELIDAPGLATLVGEDPWPILIETGIDGDPLDPPAVRADRHRAVADIEAWLADLPVGAASDRVVAVGDRLEGALTAVGRVAGNGDPGRRLGELVERTRPHVATLHRAGLPRVFEHGDPAHPNLIRRPDGRVAAVDWERGEPDGLPLHDLTISLAYIAAAVRSATGAPDQAESFREALTGDGAWTADSLDRATARLGLDPRLRPSLVVAAWARSAGWLAAHLAGGSDDPSRERGALEDRSTSRVDLPSWLAADRSVALWSVALDIADGG